MWGIFGYTNPGFDIFNGNFDIVPAKKKASHPPRRLSRNSVVRHALEPGSSPVSQIRNFSIIAHIDHGARAARGLNQLGCAQLLHKTWKQEKMERYCM